MKLPQEWQEVQLKDVAEFLRGPFGSSIKKSVCVKKSSNTYKLYAQGNVINNDFLRGNYHLTKEKFTELKKFEIEPGDVLITCAGTLGKIATVPPKIERGIINSVLMRIRLNNSKILTKFFIHYFQSPQVQIKIYSKSSGAAIKNLFATKNLKAFKISLPPIKIQKEIVSVLERAEKLKEKRKQANEKTNRIIENLFYDRFGDSNKK